MNEYISRESAKSKIERLRDKCGNDEMAFALNWALKLLDKISAADVKQVVHGKWTVISTFEDCFYAQCEKCNTTQVFYYGKQLTNYCPNCGADMREVFDE